VNGEFNAPFLISSHPSRRKMTRCTSRRKMPHLECTKMHHNTPNAPRFDAPMMHPSLRQKPRNSLNFAGCAPAMHQNAPFCTTFSIFSAPPAKLSPSIHTSADFALDRLLPRQVHRPTSKLFASFAINHLTWSGAIRATSWPDKIQTLMLGKYSKNARKFLIENCAGSVLL